MSVGYFGGDRTKSPLDDLYTGLINANHILHNHGVFDAYGHASVRNPDTENTFFMAHNSSPAMVSGVEDVIEFKVDDGAPVDEKVKVGFSERYIHSEIYKRFSGVNCVVHSHSAAILPFTVSGVPLKPVIHMAGFLGTDIPVWDISSAYSSGDKHDMLVRTKEYGTSLASAFSKTHTVAGTVYSSISSRITGSSKEPSTEPDHPVVLMRGHGMTVTGRGIEEAVYQSIFTQEAAKTQTTAMALRNAYFGAKVEGKVDLESGGKIKGGTVENVANDLQYLSTKEMTDSWSTNLYGLQRPWRLWVREVERNSLYDNTSTNA